METITRAFPVRNKQALLDFGAAIDKWSRADKAEFMARFGEGGRERWYFQLIEDKPYVISVAEVVKPEQGFDFLQTSDDAFTSWFRDQVRDLTGADLSKTPRGPASELVYELNDR